MSSELRADNNQDDILKILTFHKTINQFSFGSTNYSPVRIASLLEFLRSENYRFGSISEALKLRDKSFFLAISFDDGYQHLLDNLPPLMEKFNFKPTIFIPTFYIGKDNDWDYSYHFQNVPHLNRDGIKILASEGVEFGTHGHSHCDLRSLSIEKLKEELITSKKILEDITGERVLYVSYPFGRYNQLVETEIEKAGYQSAFTMKFPERSDSQYSRGRYAVYGFDSILAVYRKITRKSFYRYEKFKAGITNHLSGGTILFNRLFNKSRSSS